jgi:hypothetical protein
MTTGQQILFGIQVVAAIYFVVVLVLTKDK